MKGAETLSPGIQDPIPLSIVDAFAEGPFTGNPAGVCLVDVPVDEDWMGRVAAEVGASETAFVLREGDRWLLRWFTPEVEVDLCGHATLAAAHLLARPGERIRFATRSGELSATRRGDGRITLDFPRLNLDEVAPDRRVTDALGQEPTWLGRTGEDLVCVLESPEAVERAAPRLDAIEQLAPRGVAITARGGRGADITSRFFAPAAGVPEDPVTGSVHCALGPMWCELLGRTRLQARQASRRGGTLEVALAPNGRVELTGAATTVATGVISGPAALRGTSAGG